jgi:hypothetical protein
LAAAFCLGAVLSACDQIGAAPVEEASLSRRGESTELVPVPQSEVTPELAAAAQRLLERNPGAPFGSEFSLENQGKRYVARIEEHYNEPGGSERPYGHHRGVTLYRPKR